MRDHEANRASSMSVARSIVKDFDPKRYVVVQIANMASGKVVRPKDAARGAIVPFARRIYEAESSTAVINDGMVDIELDILGADFAAADDGVVVSIKGNSAEESYLVGADGAEESFQHGETAVLVGKNELSVVYVAGTLGSCAVIRVLLGDRLKG